MREASLCLIREKEASREIFSKSLDILISKGVDKEVIIKTLDDYLDVLIPWRKKDSVKKSKEIEDMKVIGDELKDFESRFF